MPTPAGDRITVLAGGVGAARYLSGLLQVVDPTSVTAVVNTGDDIVLHGLHISPDLDTVTYTLAGAINPETGWGLAGETWQAMDALGRFGAHAPAGSRAGTTWFGLGDRDLATHLYRTARLHEGASLSTVAAEVGRAFGLGLCLLPMTDDRVETRLTMAATGEEVGFQEYFVQRRHDVAVTSVRFAGVGEACPAPGVLDAIDGAGRIVVAPSNPVVSIGPVLAVAGVRERLDARRDDVVAVSPIVAGAALKGPADRLLTELGHEASVVGVARLYAPFAATLVIDEADADLAAAVEAEGVRCVVAPTIMRGPAEAAALAEVTLR
ncbi:MAG TPA: 2-phospho-L-lactate transferase [Acidimicrobiales bacterium]|nr:2-phospho-L-lactate transferase [Acidimicrobiales bacterium]